MDIIIPTCNKYLPIVEANLHGLDYFWKDRGNIVILGYDSPQFSLPERTQFVSLGKDETPSKWSDGLLKFFDSYKENRFILHMDDHCIVSPVKTDKIEKIDQIMSCDESIDKIMLHPFLVKIPLKRYEYEGLDLFICENNYGSTTLMPAVWRTAYMKRLLNKELDAHSFECQADYDSIQNKTLSTHNEILMISSLINNGVRNRYWNVCWHRNEFVFQPPNEKYVTEINKIIDTTKFQ